MPFRGFATKLPPFLPCAETGSGIGAAGFVISTFGYFIDESRCRLQSTSSIDARSIESPHPCEFAERGHPAFIRVPGAGHFYGSRSGG